VQGDAEEEGTAKRQGENMRANDKIVLQKVADKICMFDEFNCHQCPFDDMCPGDDGIDDFSVVAARLLEEDEIAPTHGDSEGSDVLLRP